MARHDEIDSLDDLAALQGVGELAATDLVDVETGSDLSLDATEFVDDDDDDDGGDQDPETIDSLDDLTDLYDDRDFDDHDWEEWDVESSADYEDTND